jgi:hypothetical protein
VLLALGAAPVGGIKTVTDIPSPADRVLVRVPDLSAARQLPVGIISVPRLESGTSASDPALSSPLPVTQTAESESVESIPVPQQTVDLKADELGVRLWPDICPLVSTPYAAALDAIFSISWSREEEPSEAWESIALPEEMSAEETTGSYAGSGTGAVQATAYARNVANPVLAISLAAITAVAVALPEMTKKRKAPLQGLSPCPLTEGVRL